MVTNRLDNWLVRRMHWAGSSVPAPDHLRAWQLCRLRKIVTHAKEKSPFYSRLLSDVSADSIKSFEDYSRLPSITPDTLRDSPQSLLCVSQDEIERVVTLASSGTTGEPKRVFYTSDDLEATMDYFGWGMSNLVGAGETALVLMPGDRPGGVGRLLSDALARTGARAITHGVMEDGDSALQHCLQENAQCVVGAPAHVNLLARAWEKRGLETGLIQSVLLCWDAVPDAVVQNVERILGCKVFRHWGMIETGLGGAVECSPGSGMHLRETDVFVEIVDPETGKVLPDGEFGELVVTTPLKMGMPLIRYRSGDTGRILPGTCKCHSPLRRLDPLILRAGNGIDIGTGILTLRNLNEALYPLEGLGDFSAEYDNGRLTITVCGVSNDLVHEVRKTLATLPLLGQALAHHKIELDIIHKRGLVPAIPGLGKRLIQEKSI